MASGNVSITIDSDIKLVEKVGETAVDICARTPLNPVQGHLVQTSVVEAVNNVIEHAYDRQGGHPIEVTFNFGEKNLIVTIRDWGKPMQDFSHPEIVFDIDNPRTFPKKGLGRFIMHQVMDDIRYRYSEGINELVLTKYFGPVIDEPVP
jgi:anti-sigma regulatory factor (Ser/Thr protein kinase)